MVVSLKIRHARRRLLEVAARSRRCSPARRDPARYRRRRAESEHGGENLLVSASMSPTITSCPFTFCGEPPSRQWRSLPVDERNFTHASCIRSHVERSVEIGARSELPSNGSEKNCDGLASFASAACSTSCWSCWRAKSVNASSTGPGNGFRGSREKISARSPVICVGPLGSRQPFHVAHFFAGYGQSNVFERMFSGTSTVMPPIASMRLTNWLKSTNTTWLTRSFWPEQLVDRPDRERRAAVLHRCVDLRVADPGNVDLEVAGDREVDEPAAARIGVEERERVGVLVDAAALRSLPGRVVGADEEDVRRRVVTATRRRARGPRAPSAARACSPR